MIITSSNISQLKCTGEKGDYVLLLPVGADIKEAFEAASMFSGSLAKLYENYKAKQEREEEQTSPSKSVKKENKNERSNSK